MNTWSSEQLRRSRGYLPTSVSQCYDRPGERRYFASDARRRRYADKHSPDRRTRPPYDSPHRNLRLPHFSTRLSHERLPDDISNDDDVSGTFVKKAFGNGTTAGTQLHTDGDQRHELSCSDYHSRYDRRDDQPHEVVWRTPPHRGSCFDIQRSWKHEEEKELHCRKHHTSHCVERMSNESSRHNLQEVLLPQYRNESVFTDRDDRNMYIDDRQTSRKLHSSNKYQTMPSSIPASSTQPQKRNKELPKGHIHSSAVIKGRKRSRSSDRFEKVSSKLQCTTEVCKRSENYRKPTSLYVAAVPAPVNHKMPDEEKQLPKPKRPAENLTIGSLFDLVSHLDAARKKTVRDFNSDLVMVLRQENEGSRLLHMRPEFSYVETTASLPDNHQDSDIDTSPLTMSDTDTDCAVRLGTHIAATVEQHIDLKKLEQTARSVSHRLQHVVAKSDEREIVCRQKPIFISTVPGSASNVRQKVADTGHKGRLASCVVSKYQRQKSKSQRSRDQRRRANVRSSRQSHAVNNIKSMVVQQPSTSSADGSRGMQRCAVGIGNKTRSPFQPQPRILHHNRNLQRRKDRKRDKVTWEQPLPRGTIGSRATKKSFDLRQTINYRRKKRIERFSVV